MQWQTKKSFLVSPTVIDFFVSSNPSVHDVVHVPFEYINQAEPKLLDMLLFGCAPEKNSCRRNCITMPLLPGYQFTSCLVNSKCCCCSVIHDANKCFYDVHVCVFILQRRRKKRLTFWNTSNVIQTDLFPFPRKFDKVLHPLNAWTKGRVATRILLHFRACTDPRYVKYSFLVNTSHVRKVATKPDNCFSPKEGKRSFPAKISIFKLKKGCFLKSI